MVPLIAPINLRTYSVKELQINSRVDECGRHVWEISCTIAIFITWIEILMLFIAI